MKTTHRTTLVSLAILGGLTGAGTALANHPAASEFWGTPVHEGQPMRMQAHEVRANRTVLIKPSTDWVRVTGGETVRFVVQTPQGEKSFYWLFDTYGRSFNFKLNEVAPAGVLEGRTVRVAVDADPRYQGG